MKANLPNFLPLTVIAADWVLAVRLFFQLTCLSLIFVCAVSQARDDVNRLPLRDFLLVPVRAHLLSGPEGSPLATTVSDEKVRQLISKANRIWAPAGIHFYLESLVREEAAPGEMPEHPHKGSPGWLFSHIPAGTWATNCLNLYFVRQCSVNGICFPNAIFVKDTAETRKVAGGADDPLARTVAHEFGHAFGLMHRHNYTNLMSPGTSGSSVNESEIKQVRAAACKFHWVQPVADISQEFDRLVRMKGTFSPFAQSLWTL